jgi:hypothetical protein
MSSGLKILLFTLLFCCVCGFVHAQKVITLRGVVFKKSTSTRLSQALITDIKSNVVMMSDELGGFSIKTAIGDTLLFTKRDYTPQKVVVTAADDLPVYLQPVIELGGVTIKDKSKATELNDVVNTYRAKGIYFDGRPTVWDIINPFGGSPITGLYELFSKDAANERRFMRFSKNELEAIEVNKRYTRQLVKQITALPDTDVTKFMQQYSPSFEDMKEWNDYELINHIKKYMVYYKTNKDSIKMQKLY